MRQRSSKIRCGPRFKELLDDFQADQEHPLSRAKATDALAEFLEEHGIPKKRRKRRGFL